MANETALSEFRDPEEYKEMLFDMFLAYLKSDEFGALTKEQRIHTVDCYEELNAFVTKDQKK